MGWSDIEDFRGFESLEELRGHLRRRAGRGQRGERFIWRFVWEMEVGDIIVANSGERRVFGIGKVLSDYLSRRDPTNRMSDSGYPHARRVEWITTESLEFEPHFFGWHPVTVEPLSPPLWKRIRRRFIEEAENKKVARRDIQALESPRLPLEGDIGAPLDPDHNAAEGAVRLFLRKHFERDAGLRRMKIRQVLADTGRLQCEVPGCGFDFAAVYGELGAEFAHVHHEEQLSKRGGSTKTNPAKLRIVCANCHAMIHRYNDCRPLKGLISESPRRRTKRVPLSIG